VLAQTTFSGRVYVPTTWEHRKAVGASTIVETFGTLYTWQHTTGASTNQMATIVARAVTLTNSATERIDLRAMTNGFGDSVTFAAVRVFGVAGGSNNLGTVTLGCADSNAWATAFGTSLVVRAGGFALLVAPDATGYAVGTNGLFDVRNDSTGTASAVLYIGGSQ
jgi:hypothetical protein